MLNVYFRKGFLVLCLERIGFLHCLSETTQVGGWLKSFYFLCEENNVHVTLVPLTPFCFFFFFLLENQNGARQLRILGICVSAMET